MLLLACFLSIPVALVLEKSGLRLALRALRRAGYHVRRTVILGGGPLAKNIYSALLRSPKLGLRPVAIVGKKKRR